MLFPQVSTWFANARRRLKKENKVTWGRSAEDRDGRIFSSDNEDEPGKTGSDEDEDEEIDLETVDIERPEGGSGRGEGEPALSVREQASDSRTLSVEALRGGGAADRSPGRQECQRPPQSKPKIWSLAETATAPESSKKPSAAAYAHQAALAPAPHPALLPGHGIYTCQIGKLHGWANTALLSANSLLNMRSLLGGAPAGHLPLQGAAARHDARHDARRAAADTSGTENESDEESTGSLSPKRDGTDCILF